MAKKTHPTADDFRTELKKWLTDAQRTERPYIDIKSGDLHRKVAVIRAATTECLLAALL